jgi:hypothetical protein
MGLPKSASSVVVQPGRPVLALFALDSLFSNLCVDTVCHVHNGDHTDIFLKGRDATSMVYVSDRINATEPNKTIPLTSLFLEEVVSISNTTIVEVENTCSLAHSVVCATIIKFVNSTRDVTSSHSMAIQGFVCIGAQDTTTRTAFLYPFSAMVKL